jgi:hypothetical protein
MMKTLHRLMTATACVLLMSGAQTATATPTSVTIDSTSVIRLGGNRYRYVEATMNGTVVRADSTVGSYSVGLVLLYPKNSNGLAVVDWPNNVYWHVVHPLYGAPGGTPSVLREEFQFQFTPATTEDYLFQQRYIYASISWNKAVTDLFGPTVPNSGEPHNRLVYGTIERGTDAWEILRDVARWLRNPNLVGLPPGARQPDASDHIIGTGFSQSGALVNQFMVQGENNHAPRPYDAFLVQFQGGVCWQRNDTAPFFGGGAACARVPTAADRNGALAMVVASESELLVRRGFFSRGIGVPDYVQYEVAGTPHLPKPIFDVSGEFGAVNQIPVDARPLFRGAVRNIKRWLRGIPPPAGRYIAGALAPDGVTFVITRDADGNATGGVRLPHMPSIDSRGDIAGAPLGSYHGIDTADPANVFRLLAGVFTPFSQAELDARYPSSGLNTIKKRGKRAVRQLVEDGFITGDDRRAYEDDPHGPN